MSSSSLWSGSSGDVLSGEGLAAPSSEASSLTSEPTDTEWLEAKRGNFVNLLRELATVDGRLLPWADRAESAPLGVFLTFMRVEHSAVAAAPPEERSSLALQAVDRAAVLLGADTDGVEFRAERLKLSRYIQLFSTS